MVRSSAGFLRLRRRQEFSSDDSWVTAISLLMTVGTCNLLLELQIDSGKVFWNGWCRKERYIYMLLPSSDAEKKALGSVVYCAGIDKCHGCKVRCFDVSPLEDGWKKVAWMHEKDRIPTRWFSMESSMSWVGTLACAEKSFWNDKSNGIILASIDATKTILLSFPNSDVVYLYEPNAKYWEVSYHNLSIYSSNFFYKRLVMVGHTLYWLTYSFQVFAYDMELRNGFGFVEAHEEERQMQKYLAFDRLLRLLHLGTQDFCIF